MFQPFRVMRCSSFGKWPWLVLLLGALPVGAGCEGGGRVDPPPISQELRADLETWLAANGQDPADYVVGLFAEHDVVLLGEQHRFRHDQLLVQELIPRLHAAGVNVLATEFVRRQDQALMDSLVLAVEWNEDLGRDLLFRNFVPWGFREYLDIYREAWRTNQGRPAGTAPFRVLGVNNTLDYSHFQSEADWDDPEVRRLVTGGQTEADWAAPVLAEVERGEKVLAHCGIHHAFTGFRQPRVVDGSFAGYGPPRFGNHLREALGDRAVTVFLHAPWNSASGYGAEFVHPADGRLDAFMLGRPAGPFAVGFDVAGSPLADLVIENAVYARGPEPLTLARFCDGWIYTMPVGEYEPVTYIEGWINEGNLERARANSMNPRWRDFSVEQLEAGCRSYRDDHQRFFGNLR